MQHRYPFQALHWLRHQRVDREAAQVSERAARTARARADEARATLARRGTEQHIAQLSQAEQGRLDQGAERAGELARAGDWRKGADADLEANAAREQLASETLRTELAAETVARRALGVASREAELVDAHGERWRTAPEASRERAEEEAAAEQWAAQRHRSRG